MAKKRLNQDDAFMSIMGKGADQSPDTVETEAVVAPETDTELPIVASKKNKPSKDKMIQTAFYITERHRKALKIRAALGDKPEDKDQSAIVRAALDLYLADTMKTFSDI